MKKHTRELQKLIERKLPVKNILWRLGGRHWKLTVIFEDGTKITRTVSVTPSDHRAMYNIVADLKRQYHAKR